MQGKQLTLVIGLLAYSIFSFSQKDEVKPVTSKVKTAKDIKTGADQTEIYIPLLNGKAIAVVGNQTSVIGKTLLVDSLVALKINLKKIFFPEHGFRGDAADGAVLDNYTDKKTGIKCFSLYGKDNKKPSAENLKDVDVVIFDLQDVGVRFYTYISTLHYVMEACAENKKTLIVFDRPNPNGYYVDGPVMEDKYKSFVGMHPVPIVYGMTIGEYAQMINGEGWLANKIKCDLKIISLVNYEHSDYYSLPVNPSPNLSAMSAIYLYPSLCLFEGTIVSVGRGTDKPFQQFGYPGMPNTKYSFTPQSIKGVSDNPSYKGEVCNGYNVSEYGEVFMKYNKQLYLFWILNAYKSCPTKDKFFNDYFLKLAGTDKLKQQIVEGKAEEEIRKSWKEDLLKFKLVRKKYLLYKDFE